MALIKCPECKKMISDRCFACPFCGFPIQNHLESIKTTASAKKEKKATPSNKKPLILLASAVGGVLLILLCLLLLLPGEDPKPTAPTTSATTEGTTEASTAPTETIEITENTVPTVPQLPDFSAYYHTYGSEEATISLSAYSPDSLLVIYEEQTFRIGTMASFEQAVPIANIQDNKVTFSFCDDWGNGGKMELTFEDKRLIASITVDTPNATAPFCVSNGTKIYPLWLEGNPVQPTEPPNLDPVPSVTPNPSTTPSSTPSGKQVGGIYIEDVSNLLPISVSQLRQDILSSNICKFYVGSERIPFDLSQLMVIKGKYVNIYSKDEYEIHLHAYFTNNSVTYEKIFTMRYKHHDIGGWTFRSYSNLMEKEYTQPVTDHYCPDGRKLINFSYDEYPSGLPISLGELADDILYGRMNHEIINGTLCAFDLASIQVISGDYWSSEYGNRMKLQLRIGFENATHIGTANVKLEYTYYDAGGWEQSVFHTYEEGLQSTHPVDDVNFQPKQADYSDAAFREAMKDYFYEIREVDRKITTNTQNNTVCTITYQATRNRQYLQEYYDIVLVATFGGRSWWEDITISLKDADYSNLMGLWEYRQGDEYIRFRVKSWEFSLNRATWQEGTSTATVTMDYECSAWKTEGFCKQDIVCEMDVVLAYVYYNDDHHKFWFHDSPAFFFSETAGVYLEGTPQFSVYFDRFSGLLVEFSDNDPVPMTKIQ